MKTDLDLAAFRANVEAIKPIVARCTARILFAECEHLRAENAQLRDAARATLSYLNLKAEQYALEYDDGHAIRASCDRYRTMLRAALKGTP